MIPYYPQPVLHIGWLSIHAFGICGALAVLVAFWTILRRGRRFGIPMEEMFQFLCVMYLCGLVCAFFAKTILDDPHAFLADPMRVFHVAAGIRSSGGLVGGLVAGLAWCAYRRFSLFEIVRRFDIMLYCLPSAWMIGRLGCALAHDHRGSFTHSWMAVRFPEGPRYDLGLIEFVFLVFVVAIFWLLDRKPRPVGFFFAMPCVLYGLFRMWLDTLHVQPLRFYEGALYVAIGLAVWGAMWVFARSGASKPPASETSNPLRTANV